MELKLSISSKFNLTATSSNRTFMELKFAKYEYKKKEEKGSNRTFMELKFS